jgi:hypothetical protein
MQRRRRRRVLIPKKRFRLALIIGQRNDHTQAGYVSLNPYDWGGINFEDPCRRLLVLSDAAARKK